MISLIEESRELIRNLCLRHRVARLEVVGSAASGGFDEATSDLDFLVEFLPLQPGEYADAYFGLLAGLEDLFGRRIDLVVRRAIENPYFLESICRNRQLLYAA